MSTKVNSKKAIVSLALIATMVAMTFLALPVQALQGSSDTLANSNQIKIRGSSTVYPISAEAKAAWESTHSSTINLPEAEGSGVGLDALTQISTSAVGCDIAAASKIPDYTSPLTATTQRNYWSTSILMSNGASNDYGMADLRIWPIGKDSVAIIVDEQNPYYAKVKDVTVSQVGDLFTTTTLGSGTPKYPTWKSFVQAIGGDTNGMGDEPINLKTRALNSGTHDGFKNFFLTPSGKTDAWLAPHQELAENQQVLDAVKDDPYALAYIGLGFLEDNPTLINGLWIGYGNGVFVEPTKAHVFDNTYCYASGKTIYRWLWYATNGIPTKDTEGALKTDYINFVKMHPQYVDHAGYVRMLKSDFCGTAPAFASQDTSPTHPSMPDDKVNAADITYFVLSYIAQYDSSRPTINPLCDYNSDHQINAADITQFVLGYIGYYNGGGT